MRTALTLYTIHTLHTFGIALACMWPCSCLLNHITIHLNIGFVHTERDRSGCLLFSLAYTQTRQQCFVSCFFLLHFANAGMCHCVLSVHAYSGLFVIPSIHSPVCVFVPINKLCVRSLVCLCTANTYAIVATQKNSWHFKLSIQMLLCAVLEMSFCKALLHWSWNKKR